jgi:Icc protein
MAVTKPVRVLQITDPHLFADKSGRLRGVVTYDSLQQVLADYHRRDWIADLAIVTGDLIQDDSREAYHHFRDLFGDLGLPVHCVPGNHDVRSVMREALASPPFHYCKSARVGDWLITGIDSCVDGDAGGHVSADELDRLAGVLAATDAAHVAVCLHHPPLPMGSRWLDTVGLANGDEFLDLVGSAGNVRLAIFGHVHQAFDVSAGDVRVIGTPSSCAQFLPGADTFAIDERPPAYRRFQLWADGSADTELIWLGGDE